MSRNADTMPGLSIADVAARTGIAIATLRAWETRYGFPEPKRLPSGHRRYDEHDIEMLNEIVRARAEGLSLETAIDHARRMPARVDLSIFAAVRRADPYLVPVTLPKRALLAISRAIEDETLARGERVFAFGSFQTEKLYRASEARWHEIARTASYAAVFASFARRNTKRTPIEVALARDAPLGREWAVVIDGESFGACMAGWERPARSPAGERTFETVWTTDPRVVREAVQVCASFVGDETLAGRLVRPQPATGMSVRNATAVTARALAYMAALQDV
jgi:MerR family transcriptional regulator, light-induced transcriptional regulator